MDRTAFAVRPALRGERLNGSDRWIARGVGVRVHIKPVDFSAARSAVLDLEYFVLTLPFANGLIITL